MLIKKTNILFWGAKKIIKTNLFLACQININPNIKLVCKNLASSNLNYATKQKIFLITMVIGSCQSIFKIFCHENNKTNTAVHILPNRQNYFLRTHVFF